jgi:hypothetical protein
MNSSEATPGTLSSSGNPSSRWRAPRRAQNPYQPGVAERTRAARERRRCVSRRPAEEARKERAWDWRKGGSVWKRIAPVGTSEADAGSVGAGERRRRRRAAAGGGEPGQAPEEGEEEKAAALGTGQARRWRNSGSHCSIGGWQFLASNYAGTRWFPCFFYSGETQNKIEKLKVFRSGMLQSKPTRHSRRVRLSPTEDMQIQDAFDDLGGTQWNGWAPIYPLLQQARGKTQRVAGASLLAVATIWSSHAGGRHSREELATPGGHNQEELAPLQRHRLPSRALAAPSPAAPPRLEACRTAPTAGGVSSRASLAAGIVLL